MAASSEGIERARKAIKQGLIETSEIKFSINFKSKNIDDADEIRCPFNQVGRIYDFIKNNPNKRYNITIEEETQTDFYKLIEQIEYVRAVAGNYTVQCGDLELVLHLIKQGYNAFLRFPVSDWETFMGLRDIGVSDIYIDGPLGFQCTKLKIGKQDNTLIRVSPTVSPNISFSAKREPNSFFIRPEDIKFYSSAIDIIDFKEPDQDKEDALFSIYKRGTFNYGLDDLIKGLSPSINNILLNSNFVECRLDCGQKCKIPGRTCHLCNNYFIFTDKVTSYLKSKQKDNIEKQYKDNV